MRRVLKILLALVVIVIAAMAVFLFSFDINRYKPELVALVERQTGRSFGIAGEIRFAPSLLPTIVIDGVTLGNAAWANDAEFIHIEHAEAQVALKPLLQRRIEVKRIGLSGVTVNLQTNGSGESNWTLGKATEQSAAPAFAKAPLSILAVESLSVEKSSLQFRVNGIGTAHLFGIETFTATAPSREEPIAVGYSGIYRARPIKVQGKLGSWAALTTGTRWPVDVEGDIGDTTFTARGDIVRLRSGDPLNLALTVKAANLATVGKLLGMTLPPLTPVALSATLANDENRYLLRDLKAQAGRSEFVGHLTVTPATTQPDVTGELSAGLIDLTETRPPAKGQNGRMFSIEPVFINQLPPVRAHLTLRAKELRTHRMTLADVTAELALQDGKLQIDPLQAQAAGGKVDGHIGIVPAPGAPQVVLALQGKGILPGQLPQFQGKHLTGARTDLTLDITGNGRSIAEVMGNGNGHVLVRMGPGHIPNNLATADLLLDTVRLLNPLSARDRNTSIECAVFNFGVRNGLATSRRGIAVRTDQLTVLGGGVVNLKTEGIHIGVKPKAIAGTGLSLASLGGDLVHIGGTLSDPKPVANTDAQAVAGAGLKVGAAVATAGLSLLAEGLFDRATADDDVCDIALHGAARPSVTAETGAPAHQEKSVIGKATDKTRKAVRGTGETVQGALKKLFGR